MPYILIGMYTRPLPASDTDGDRNIQVLDTQFFSVVAFHVVLFADSAS